jgi:hypothetical protein
MKIITQKQRETAMDELAELLKRDGWVQTKSIEQWLDEAEMSPAQFQSSLGALKMLSLLGFGNDVVTVAELT